MDSRIGVGIISGLIIGLFFLIYDYFKNRSSKEERDVEKEEDLQSELFNIKTQTLEELKEKGILTEQEYEEKIKKVVDENISKSLENYTEYKQLKALYKDDILTKEEFENKVRFLKNKLKARIAKQEEGEPYYEGLRTFTDKELNYGFEDELGNILVEPIYEYADNFKEGLALVRQNGKFGFINKLGDVVIDIKFDDAKSFNNGFALVLLGNKEFFIDKSGEKNGNY